MTSIFNSLAAANPEIAGRREALAQKAAGEGIHVAIIMDGNGRWAAARGLPRLAGHRAGADAVRRTIEAAPDLGISILTLYAFSADNWRRPTREVDALMRLLGRYLKQERARCIANGVRLEAIGRRDRLPKALVALLEETERATAGGGRLHLRLAIDYSARQSIVEAAKAFSSAYVADALSKSTPASGGALRDFADGPGAGGPKHDAAGFDGFSCDALSREIGPDVDLVIRTSGEQRLSDFLLWECAYAEMLFTERMWPDFAESDLAAAVNEFHRRERRFGGLVAQRSA